MLYNEMLCVPNTYISLYISLFSLSSLCHIRLGRMFYSFSNILSIQHRNVGTEPFFFFELRTVFMGLNGISPPLHMKGPARRGEAGSRGARSSRARGGGLVLTPKRRSHS